MKLNWNALIASKTGEVSLGRVSYWVCMIMLIVFWVLQWNVVSSLETVFLALMGYNLGTKVNETLQAHYQTKQMSKKDKENITP